MLDWDRSIWKKLKNFITEAEETGQGIGLPSEVWQKKESKNHKGKIEEMLEISGISYASTPRPGRRGGGSAITCDEKKYDMKHIRVENPDELEVTFAIIKPKAKEARNINIIACSFYSVPRSRKKEKLVDFITENYHKIKSKYPSAYFIGGGDINDLKIDHLLAISPAFKNISNKPTRKDKVLDVLITDLSGHYDETMIMPPIEPDVPGDGKPSDHSGVLGKPRVGSEREHKTYETKVIRPLPDSKMHDFGQWLVKETFDNIKNVDSPTEMVKVFQETINKKIEEVFPEKELKVFENDKEWMTEEIQKN